MSKISTDDVRKVAVLSGLRLSDEDLDTYREQFEKIISFVEQLDTLDTTGREPTYQVTGLTNVTRPDEIIDYGVSTDELLKNAPDQQDNQIKVERVL
jgi:aspartyl-tRNA(Asn)/glutamyl-tRNA(Gln) amidotransferase subunit C